jgi:LacI family transcriptional regulator
MARRNFTMSDVARDAGLSIKTVSRVLNDEPFVRDDTRRQVMASVKKLNYQRNAYARGLRADSSNIYALFYEDPEGGYHAGILHGVLGECRAQGVHVMVEMLRGNAAAQLESFVAQVRLDGAVLTPPLCDDAALLAVLERYGVPAARLSPATMLSHGLVIGIDDEAAAYDLTAFLLAQGHRRIGFVEGIPGHIATTRRRDGYARALAEQGVALDETLIHRGHFDIASGLEAGRDLLGLATPPSAIIAGNDETAAGVMAAAYALGRRVPDDFSLCGFDDSPIAAALSPPLTTIRQPTRQFGSDAIRLLRQQRAAAAAGTAYSAMRMVMAHQLIERDSARPPAGVESH